MVIISLFSQQNSLLDTAYQPRGERVEVEGKVKGSMREGDGVMVVVVGKEV